MQTLIFITTVLLLIFSGCKEKTLLSESEIQCSDILGLVPTATVAGDIIEGNDIELKAEIIDIGLPEGSTFNWEGPNGFKAEGAKVKIKTLDSTHTGMYYVYVKRDECKSKTGTQKIEVAEAPENCALTANWMNVSGLRDFENVRFGYVDQGITAGGYYIYPKSGTRQIPDVQMVLNQPQVAQGTYIIVPDINPFNLPAASAGKYAAMHIHDVSYDLANYTNAKLKIIKNTSGEFELTVCGAPMKDKKTGISYFMKMRVVFK